MDSLRIELQTLRPRALQKRAETDGVDEAVLDAALDADSPKNRIIELIVGKPVTAGPIDPKLSASGTEVQSRPHYGSRNRPELSAVVPLGLPGAKHAMLSYQWDSQEQVKRVRTLLNTKGQKT